MPFSDPMADGPAIQAASLRALRGGMTLTGTLQIAAAFRQRHPDVPLILMGYYNPIYIYGNDRFIADALAAGVDGLIIVDLPPEEDSELCLNQRNRPGLKFIRLVTPHKRCKPPAGNFGRSKWIHLLCIGFGHYRHEKCGGQLNFWRLSADSRTDRPANRCRLWHSHAATGGRSGRSDRRSGCRISRC